jgi:hypothetical protein
MQNLPAFCPGSSDPGVPSLRSCIAGVDVAVVRIAVNQPPPGRRARRRSRESAAREISAFTSAGGLFSNSGERLPRQWLGTLRRQAQRSNFDCRRSPATPPMACKMHTQTQRDIVPCRINIGSCGTSSAVDSTSANLIQSRFLIQSSDILAFGDCESPGKQVQT